MKKHFVLTCLAYVALGFGMATQAMGIKAALGLYPTLGFFVFCMLFWLIITFTSLQKVKDFISEKEEEKQFDFEDEIEE